MDINPWYISDLLMAKGSFSRLVLQALKNGTWNLKCDQASPSVNMRETKKLFVNFNDTFNVEA